VVGLPGIKIAADYEQIKQREKNYIKIHWQSLRVKSAAEKIEKSRALPIKAFAARISRFLD
jgi:hypothetical protein